MSSDIQGIYEHRKTELGHHQRSGCFARRRHRGAVHVQLARAFGSDSSLLGSVGLGISMGYHRLHTHRSYKLPRALEYFLAFCGTLSLEGGPIFWVATHRIHHQYSDKPGDPHSPRDGAWWSHIGWLLVGESKHNDTKLMSKYAPDLARDPFYAHAEHLPLGADHCGLGAAVDLRRPSDVAVGHLHAPHLRPARHLDGELDHAHVGAVAASARATIPATTC